jgi:hypothetical protein
MTLDGFDIDVGDVVFDTQRGPGTVTEIRALEGSVVVLFHSGRMSSYTGNGANNLNQKTLFWSTPVAFTPPKMAAQHPNWGVFNRLVAHLATELLK